MQVIYETRYLGPTNERGGRVRAQRQLRLMGEGKWQEKSATVGWNYSLDISENHQAAIRRAELAQGRTVQDINWGGECKSGTLWIVDTE